LVSPGLFFSSAQWEYVLLEDESKEGATKLPYKTFQENNLLGSCTSLVFLDHFTATLLNWPENGLSFKKIESFHFFNKY
jgi:hypothetical protein